jgi:hypothetical protein
MRRFGASVVIAATAVATLTPANVATAVHHARGTLSGTSAGVAA